MERSQQPSGLILEDWSERPVFFLVRGDIMSMKPMRNSMPDLRSQVPHGVQDRLLQEAVRRRQAEAAVRASFVRWGYMEVIPPTFEYQDNLAVGASAELEQAMYRFFDREGHTLALRADFTPQVARIAATKLFDQPMPLRCSYVGSLFRHEEPQAGRKREFTQAGVELVGADTPAADAEVVSLAIATLEALGLQEFQVNLGQMAFFRALTIGLPQAALPSIRQAVDEKNRARLLAALKAAGVTGDWRGLLVRLPSLVGGIEILEQARALSRHLPQRCELVAATGRLEETHHLLQAYGVANRVILDLGEVRGMDYYTGVTFRGVAPGLGWPLISGGRYDHLIEHFGRPLPAVGFGLGLERALLVQRRQGAVLPSVAPHALVGGCHHSACLALVQRLRLQGCRVEVDLWGLDTQGLLQQACQRGCPRALHCANDGWLLIDEEGERILTEAALLDEAKSWLP
jgi:ATP phosphoribosyltransferase regulatory subunit